MAEDKRLDQFDLLGAIVNWVEKGTSPASIIATGKAFPGRSRPLCPYPKHAQYKGRETRKMQPTSIAVNCYFCFKEITSMRSPLVVFTLIVLGITVPMTAAQKVELSIDAIKNRCENRP